MTQKWRQKHESGFANVMLPMPTGFFKVLSGEASQQSIYRLHIFQIQGPQAEAHVQ